MSKLRHLQMTTQPSFQGLHRLLRVGQGEQHLAPLCDDPGEGEGVRGGRGRGGRQRQVVGHGRGRRQRSQQGQIQLNGSPVEGASIKSQKSMHSCVILAPHILPL